MTIRVPKVAYSKVIIIIIIISSPESHYYYYYYMKIRVPYYYYYYYSSPENRSRCPAAPATSYYPCTPSTPASFLLCALCTGVVEFGGEGVPRGAPVRSAGGLRAALAVGESRVCYTILYYTLCTTYYILYTIYYILYSIV